MAAVAAWRYSGGHAHCDSALQVVGGHSMTHWFWTVTCSRPRDSSRSMPCLSLLLLVMSQPKMADSAVTAMALMVKSLRVVLSSGAPSAPATCHAR